MSHLVRWGGSSEFEELLVPQSRDSTEYELWDTVIVYIVTYQVRCAATYWPTYWYDRKRIRLQCLIFFPFSTNCKTELRIL